MTTVNGLVVMTPTSIVSTGTGNSSSINADGSVDFSSCVSLSLNGVFTSDYDSYMIVVRDLNGINSNNWRFRLRASGTDNTTASSWNSQDINASSTTVNAGRTTQSYGIIAQVSATQRNGFTSYIFGPFLAQPTAIRSTVVNGDNSATLRDWALTHNQSTSYDGCTLYLNTSSGSGLLTVFGFNQ